jgi:hypothetical protein
MRRSVQHTAEARAGSVAVRLDVWLKMVYKTAVCSVLQGCISLLVGMAIITPA